MNQTHQAIANDIEPFVVLESLPKLQKLSAEFNDPEFQIPPVTLNNINDTYAPLDVFDWCDIIRKESETLTQEETGKNLGISQPYFPIL